MAMGNKAETVKAFGAGRTRRGPRGTSVRSPGEEGPVEPAGRHAASPGDTCADADCLGRGRADAASPGDTRAVWVVAVRRRRYPGGGHAEATHVGTPLCPGYGCTVEIDVRHGKHENVHMSPNGTSVLPFLKIRHEKRYFCQKRVQQCYLEQKLVIHRTCTELQGELNLAIYYQIYRPIS